MNKQLEAESRYIIVAFTDMPKRHKGTKRRFTAEFNGSNVPKSEFERNAEMSRASQICSNCPLRRKCRPNIYTTISYLDKLYTVPAIAGNRLDNRRCGQTWGRQHSILYQAK